MNLRMYTSSAGIVLARDGALWVPQFESQVASRKSQIGSDVVSEARMLKVANGDQWELSNYRSRVLLCETPTSSLTHQLRRIRIEVQWNRKRFAIVWWDLMLKRARKLRSDLDRVVVVVVVVVVMRVEGLKEVGRVSWAAASSCGFMWEARREYTCGPRPSLRAMVCARLPAARLRGGLAIGDRVSMCLQHAALPPLPAPKMHQKMRKRTPYGAPTCPLLPGPAQSSISINSRSMRPADVAVGKDAGNERPMEFF
ncbi:hypothetical protein K438DRAFT_1763617 [Mycena galopus ATCC 62051]|nr:hypothetical protein K438DRAFT_1763617 [Mycena galopus ATCC 62051]